LHPPRVNHEEQTMKKPVHFARCAARYSLLLLFSAGLFASCTRATAAQRPQKDYLTSIEADKIRDAETTNERIKLFLTYADDRLKKFQYEVEHPSQTKHPEMLNFLINSYSGCIDDAADLIQLGLEKQDNIREGIDLMSTKTKEFLPILQKVSTDNGPDLQIFKDNLDDAIEGTQDAMNESEKAKKKAAPPPVRRKT
jgi:hypothetical protein